MTESDSHSSSNSDEEKQETTDYIAPLQSAADNKSDRKHVFNRTQAWQWSKKSIALEFESMLLNLQEQAIDLAGSDIGNMSDSDMTGGGGGAGSADNALPNVDDYVSMLTAMDYVQSVDIMEPKFESNKAFKQKLDYLHERIGIFIKKVGTALTETKNHKLKTAYQSAYDFLEEIHHEIEGFDENISNNENKLNQMENKIKSTESKYKSLMFKFKNAKQSEQAAKAQAMTLKKQIHELSIEYSQLMLKSINKFSESGTGQKQKKKIDEKDIYIPQQLQLPVVTETILMKKVALKPIPAKPKLKYPEKPETNHKYIYDNFKEDHGDKCVSQFWAVFGQEIGFFPFNRHG